MRPAAIRALGLNEVLAEKLARLSSACSRRSAPGHDGAVERRCGGNSDDASRNEDHRRTPPRPGIVAEQEDPGGTRHARGEYEKGRNANRGCSDEGNEPARSEERRVGKEWRSRGSRKPGKEKEQK